MSLKSNVEKQGYRLINEIFENREIKPKSVLVEKRRDLDCSTKISKKRYDIVTISISKTTIFSN